MPRKSAALRLSQSQDLLGGYTEASLENSYQGRFIRDVVSRLERNKGLSKRQRDWIDTLIEEGVPAPKGDPEVVAKLENALTYWKGNADREWESGVLADFKARMVQGKDLSEKQNALLEKLLMRAADDAAGLNTFDPDEEQLQDLKNLVLLYAGYSFMWRDQRPAVAKAVRRVQNFLDGIGTIEVYHYNKLYKSMGSKLRKVNSPKFGEGSLGWVRVKGDTGEHESKVATCLTSVYVNEKGWIVNDWLVDGLVITKLADDVKKRR